MNYIDLFAGAGGLSEGFLQAGFEPVAHIEMNSDACNTIRTRACYYYLKNTNHLDIYLNYERGNISRSELYQAVPQEVLNSVINAQISEESIKDIFLNVDALLAANPNFNNTVDVIIGGPPCQAYSLIGRAVKDDNMENDPRNYLYKLYCRFLKKYQPRMFVFENVPGLLTANGGRYFENIKRYLRHVGYKIDWRELNAKDFGVLQSRRRIIIVGWRADEDHFYPTFDCVKHQYTVNDILSDLPIMQAVNEEYLAGQNRTFKFSIPVPTFRNSTDKIAIEHYFRDDEIMTEDAEKHRLFMAKEFTDDGTTIDDKYYCKYRVFCCRHHLG